MSHRSPPAPSPNTPEDMHAQRAVIDGLLDSSCYPHAAKRVRLVETHISWVLLAGRYVYKIKKAVDLGFLDFSQLSSRRHYCEEEIRLNRRLAPQIYLDVISIGGTPEAPAWGGLPAIEYAVRMKRFPVSCELDRLAVRGKLLPQHMDSLAATIAQFHASLLPAETGSAFGSPDNVHAAVSAVFDRLRTLLQDSEDEASVTALREAMETEWGNCSERFRQRHARGFIRECHGDLHLGNIALIDGRPVPFDGIEFDPALRWIDVMSEVAFTVMDLLRHGYPALAYRFLNAYLEITGDYGGVPLLSFYVSYRAAVRAMVSAIRAGQNNLPPREVTKALDDSHNFLALAGERLAQRRPALIITHGLPGSGKSTFAQAALERLQTIRIRSDVERKRLFGLPALADSRSHAASIYGADATRRTYERLHELARDLLIAGIPVIVDAAFLRQDERDHFRRLAMELRAPFAIASIHADTATLRERIVQRRNAADDASEADLAVLEKLENEQEVLTSQEQVHAVVFSNEGAGITADAASWDKLTLLLQGVDRPFQV